MNFDSRIYIAGATTMLGCALRSQLQLAGFTCVLEAPDPDFTDRRAVDALFADAAPEYVFMAAGRQGGIDMNRRQPATLMLDNMLTISHVLESAHRHAAKKLLYVASSCVYPRLAPQPMQIESLLHGPFEPTNDAYATAKLAGIKMCQAYRTEYGANFISAIPANMFGPGDHFDPKESHVIGALMYRMTEARERGAENVEIWGTGLARREFVYIDDIARACIFVMHSYDGGEPINLGGGEDVSIKELALLLKDVTRYAGEITFDESKPDGMPLKSLDSQQLLDLGWRPRVSFRSALDVTYASFVEARDASRKQSPGAAPLRN